MILSGVLSDVNTNWIEFEEKQQTSEGKKIHHETVSISSHLRHVCSLVRYLCRMNALPKGQNIISYDDSRRLNIYIMSSNMYCAHTLNCILMPYYYFFFSCLNRLNFEQLIITHHKVFTTKCGLTHVWILIGSKLEHKGSEVETQTKSNDNKLINRAKYS